MSTEPSEGPEFPGIWGQSDGICEDVEGGQMAKIFGIGR